MWLNRKNFASFTLYLMFSVSRTKLGNITMLYLKYGLVDNNHPFLWYRCSIKTVMPLKNVSVENIFLVESFLVFNSQTWQNILISETQSFSDDMYTEKFIFFLYPNPVHFKYNAIQVELHSKNNLQKSGLHDI